MNGPVVFDFDKTLTAKDTLFGFYSHVNNGGIIFKIKRVILLCGAFLYKIRIINNTQLKKLGLNLFLAGKSYDFIEKKSHEYAKKIELNQIYHQYFLKTPKEKRLIISASYECYLKQLFPFENVMGSKLEIKNGKVFGLKKNMYGIEKKKKLIEREVASLDVLYTDSYSDFPIMEIADNVYLIHDNSVVRKIK